MKRVFHCNMFARVGGWCLFALAVWLGPLSVAHSQTLQDSLQAAIDAMEYHPGSVDLRLKKAAINMQMEQWQLAKDEYDIVLQQQPGHLAALYFRAYANQQLRRYQFARLDYEQLLRIVPAHFEARLGLALLNQHHHARGCGHRFGTRGHVKACATRHRLHLGIDTLVAVGLKISQLAVTCHCQHGSRYRLARDFSIDGAVGPLELTAIKAHLLWLNLDQMLS